MTSIMKKTCFIVLNKHMSVLCWQLQELLKSNSCSHGRSSAVRKERETFSFIHSFVEFTHSSVYDKNPTTTSTEPLVPVVDITRNSATCSAGNTSLVSTLVAPTVSAQCWLFRYNTKTDTHQSLKCGMPKESQKRAHCLTNLWYKKLCISRLFNS